MEKEFQIYGRVSFLVEMDVIGNNQEDALKKAIDIIKDMYSLDCYGGYHFVETVDYSKLDVTEYR